MRNRQRQLTPDEARGRLERLCARGEVSTSEAFRKLRGWAIADKDAATIVEELIRDRFIDDSRYARAYARDKYRFQRWGRRRIAAELSMRRIPREIVAAALDEIDSEEYCRIAFAALKAKARSLGPEASTYTGRAKLMRFALARGYESDLVSKLISRLPRNLAGEENAGGEAEEEWP